MRLGKEDNPLVFPEADYSSRLLECGPADCILHHVAAGADLFRFSFDYGQTWSNWTPYEGRTRVNLEAVTTTNPTWFGIHCMVQYWSSLAQSASATVHADADYSGPERRKPRYMIRSAFNKWGLDEGMTTTMSNGGLMEGWHCSVGPGSIQPDDRCLSLRQICLTSVDSILALKPTAQRLWLRRLLLRGRKRRRFDTTASPQRSWSVSSFPKELTAKLKCLLISSELYQYFCAELSVSWLESFTRRQVRSVGSETTRSRCDQHHSLLSVALPSHPTRHA
jgi:hypothetical protein